MKEFLDGQEFLDQHQILGEPVFNKEHELYPIMIKLLNDYGMYIAKESGFWGGFASRMSTRLKEAMKFLKSGKEIVVSSESYTLHSEKYKWKEEVQEFMNKNSLYVS